MSTGQGTVLCSREDSNRSGISLVLRHIHCDIYNYGLTGLGKGDKHPAYTPSVTLTFTVLLPACQVAIQQCQQQPASPLSANRSIIFARWQPHVHPSNTRLLGPTPVYLQMAFRSVQSFLHRVHGRDQHRDWDKQTNTQTDHATNSPHLVLVMRAKTCLCAKNGCWLLN